MYEVEVKVRADHATVRERLDELGAEPIDAVEQADTYYDAPHREFAETDEALRVRRETRQSDDSQRDNEADDPQLADEAEEADDSDSAEAFAELTYKGPLVEAESKTRREVETRVEDGEAAGDILSALGFDPAATVRKARERFGLDGYTVTLDAVAGLGDAGGVGEFVEVETEVGDEASVESAREEAFEILRDLGLDPSEQIRTSYLGLLLAQESEE